MHEWRCSEEGRRSRCPVGPRALHALAHPQWRCSYSPFTGGAGEARRDNPPAGLSFSSFSLQPATVLRAPSLKTHRCGFPSHLCYLISLSLISPICGMGEPQPDHTVVRIARRAFVTSSEVIGVQEMLASIGIAVVMCNPTLPAAITS